MRPWSTAFLAACLIASALAATPVAPAVSTVTASTGDSFTYNPNLPVPNRVLNIPLDLPPAEDAAVAITVAGTGFAFTLNNGARLTVLPSFCAGCTVGTGGPGGALCDASTAAITATATATATGFTFTLPLAVDNRAEAFGQNNFGTRGRLCLVQNGVPAVANQPFATTDLGFLVVSYNCAGTPTCDVNFINTVNDPANDFSRWLSGDRISELLTRTTECNVGTGAAVCTCFNARSTIACCQGKQYDTTLFKCCGNGNIVNLNDACPCTTDTQCGQSEPLCCVQTKYPELRNSSTGVLTNTTGQCYNPNVHRCCDTGFRYDPGQDQCCTINGVQSLNVPCPCSQNIHCAGGQAVGQRTNNFICCSQTAPVPAEVTSCSIYSNFPSGTGPFSAQRCLGQCIDPSYQLCCNGNACIKEYERCCNTTCCNTFIGACHRVEKDIAGQRYNTLNSFLNPNDPNSPTVVFERCTTIEQMTPIRAFWIFVLPTAFLAATFLALAVALVFANKAAVRVFSWVERFIVFFAVILTLLACPLYFSPLYKYGAVIAAISFWAIITAATRVRWVNAVAIGALIFLQIYLYDPFHGSAYFNLAYWRIWIESPFAGATDPRSNGILHTTRMMFPNVTTTNQAQWCSRYYDYFIYDPELRAPLRNDNPLRTTFGYCSRGWVMALYLLAGFIFIASLFLLLLAIIALVSRFRKELLEPVELEVRAVEEFAPVY